MNQREHADKEKMLAALPYTLSLGAAVHETAPPVPHLAQAWVAMSSGDGLPGATGKESYLYEKCGPKGEGPQSVRPLSRCPLL